MNPGVGTIMVPGIVIVSGLTRKEFPLSASSLTLQQHTAAADSHL